MKNRKVYQIIATCMFCMSIVMVTGCGKTNENESVKTDLYDVQNQMQTAVDENAQNDNSINQETDTENTVGEMQTNPDTDTEQDFVNSAGTENDILQENSGTSGIKEGTAAENVMESSQNLNDSANATEDVTYVEEPELKSVSDDSDYYSICTSYSKQEVESFALEAKNSVLSGDWEKVSGMIIYPITIKGVKYKNAEDLAKAEIGFSQTFTEQLAKEECTNLFANWQGIMLGNGCIWIGEVYEKDTHTSQLKIIAINEME